MKLFNSLLLTLVLSLPVIGFSADSININTADKETLMSVIKGVGDKCTPSAPCGPTSLIV